jgi:hypothetical protein
MAIYRILLDIGIDHFVKQPRYIIIIDFLTEQGYTPLMEN